MNMSGKLFRKISLLLVLFIFLSGELFSATYYYRLKEGITSTNWTEGSNWEVSSGGAYTECDPDDYPGVHSESTNDNIVWLTGSTEVVITLDMDIELDKITFNSDGDPLTANNQITIDLNGHNLTTKYFDLGETDEIHNVESNVVITGSGTINAQNLRFDPSAAQSITINAPAILNADNFTTGDEWNNTDPKYGITFSGDGTLNIENTIPAVDSYITKDTTLSGDGIIKWTGAQDSDTTNINNWTGISSIASLETELEAATEIHFLSTALNPPSAAGDLVLGTSSPATAIYIGTDIEASGNITFNGTVTLNADSSVTAGSNKSIILNAPVNADTVGTRSLSLTAKNFNQNMVAIGTTTALKDLTITVSDSYEALSNATLSSPITCTGNLTVNGIALFRGNLSAQTISVSRECQFLGATSTVHTSANQLYEGNVITNISNLSLTSDSGDIELKKNINSWDTTARSISFEASSLTIGGKIGNANALGSTDITANTIFKDTINIDGDLSVNGTCSITANITTTDDQTYGGTVTLNDDIVLDADSYDIIFGAAVKSKAGENHNLEIQCGTVSFNSVSDIDTLILNADTTLNGDIETAKWENSQSKTITPGTSTVTITDSITGNNNFYNLTIPSGSIFSFEAGKTQTIANTFTASNSILQSSTSGSQWTIDVATANATVSSVQVEDSNSVNLITPTGSCTNLGNNINWAIGSAYRWIGGTSAAWNNASNWQMNTTGTTWISATTYPGQFSPSDSALIGSANKTTNWPEFSLSSDLTISSIQIGDSTADTTSHLDFSSTGNIKLSDATPVTNYGTVKYTSTGRLTNDGATPSAVMDASHGTVYFDTGAVTIDNVDTADYYNLIVNGTGHTLGGAIAVTHNFTLETSSSITSGTSLSVTGTSSIGGDITTTGTQTYTGAVTLNDDITFKAGTNTVTFGSTINCATGSNYNLTIGSAAVHTKATIQGNVGATNALDNITTYGQLKMNSGSIRCTGDILVNAGGAEFRGNVSANSISITGTTTVGTATQSITTTGTISPSSPYSQVYNGAFQFHYANLQLTAETYSIAFNGTVDTYSSATSARSLSIGTAAKKTNAVFTHSVGATNTYPLDTLSVAGTTAFDATVTDVKTSGAQTYTGNVSYSSDITFAAGSDTTTAITTGATSDFTDSSATPHNVIISKGAFAFGTGNFITGILTVQSDASFTQTGDNGANTQSIKGIVNNGITIWDASKAGGTLTVGTEGITIQPEDDNHLVVFNNKNVNFSGASAISGVFYNLEIPVSTTLTNSYKIVVLNNFTANGTYVHNGKILHLGKITIGSDTFDNGDEGEISGTETGTPASLSLGAVTIAQSDKTKNFLSNISITDLTCEDTSADGIIDFNKNLTVTGTSSLTTAGTIKFNSASTAATDSTKFTNAITIANAKAISVRSILATTGTNQSISITPDTTLSANTTIQTTGGAVTLNKITGTTSTLDITSGTGTTGAITLNKAVTVKELTIVNPASLAIKQAASITAADGFTLTGAGTVALGTASATANLSITTANTDINFNGTGAVTFLSPIVLTTGTGNGNIILNQNFNGTTAGTEKLTLNSGTGNITINANLGSTTSLGDTTITGNAITLEDSRALRASKVTVTNSDTLLLKPSSAVTAATGFTKTGAGYTQLASSITTTNSAISFNNQTYIYGASSFNAGTANVTIGTGSGTNEDLYISALSGTTAQAVSFTAGTLDVKGNVALFNGNVTLASNLSSGKDIVLLNGNASTMYNETTVSGLYDYHNSLRTSANKLCPPTLNITITPSHYPESMPDGTTTIAHTSYSSSLTGFEGKTIKAGQNFYDNGVDLSATASWTLKLKDNDSSLDSFAELYHASISYCQIECNTTGGYAWLSAGETVTDGGNNNADDTALINYSLDGSFTRVKTGVAFIRPVILSDDTTQSASEGRKTGPEVPNLSGTYSVRDNVIRIEFVRSNYSTGSAQSLATALIENSNNEISKAVAANFFKYNGGTETFEGVYIDAECTVSTDNQGDIAVFYLKAPDNKRWNLDATGIAYGTDSDTTGTVNSRYTDIQIQKAIAGVFATLTDDHKNRISSYYGNPTASPSSAEGFRFTATTSRCAFGNMHITFAIADFTSNKIYLYFDNPLSDTITWETYNPGTPIKTEDAIKIYSTPTTQDTTFSVVSVDRNALNDHGLVLTLNQDLDYTKLQYGIKIEYGGSFLFNNKIHSPDRKVVISGESHCISDFLVNAIDVQYAYDNRNTEYIDSMSGDAAEDSIAIRDFSGTTKRNKLFANKNITLVTKNITDRDDLRFKMCADITPSAHCEGEEFTKYSGLTTRAWFPNIYGTPVTTFSPSLNTSSNIEHSSDAGSGAKIESDVNTTTNITTYLLHNFNEETPCLNWQTGSDVRFIFEVLDGSSEITINHSYNATTPVNTPLYAVRLKAPGELTSIDAWSFLISQPQRQRGGVTIYSNVINSVQREFCTLEVNLAKEDSLRVIVMTADGNIVQYLENGRQSAGLHYYYWHGDNMSGDAVARGIYFIRIVSSDIDETRKVLVVK